VNPLRTRRGLAVLPALALVLAAACGGGSEEAEPTSSLRESVEISGDFGSAPTIVIDSPPLEVEDTESWTVEKGDGDEVTAGATVILQLTLVNGRTGKKAISTFDQGATPLEVATDQVFPSLSEALTGSPAGSRIAVASTPEDTYGDQGQSELGIKGDDSVVMVADILSTDPTSVLDGPTGDTLSPPSSAPKLLEEDGVPTGFDVSGLKKPTKLVVVPLREGTGPEIEAPDRVKVNYLGQVWGAEKPFQESFTSQPTTFTVGLDKVIKAWDQALVGVKEGGRVMLVAPPALAYGKAAQQNIPANSTLIFVIDVLGVG